MPGNEQIIYGRQPVLEAFSSNITVERVVVRIGASGRVIKDIYNAAKSKSVRIDRLPPQIFDRKFDFKASGGVAAVISLVRSVELEELLQSIRKTTDHPFLIILDGIEDPHNLGAIARSAEAAGCNGIIIPRRRSAPLNEVAIKASAGTLLNIPVAKAANLASVVDRLKKEGLWIYGADMSGEDYRKLEYAESLALIVGSEGYGISKLVRSKCDQLVSIPMKGKVNSLNASVSAGILLFHVTSSR